MATTFDDNETSADRSRPIDLYVIATPTKTYYLTSNVADVVFGSQTYTAITLSRGSQALDRASPTNEYMIHLPITHEIVQRYAATGIPEGAVTVTHSRLQAISGAAIQQWTGQGQSLSMDGHVAAIRVSSLTADTLRIQLPTVAAQRSCNHMLYDAQCTLSRAAFSLASTIVSVSGVTVVLSTTFPADAGTVGTITHVASSQWRTVLLQSGNTLTLNVALVGVQAGDSVTIARGCDHTVATCKTDFNNVANFGGIRR